MSAKPPLKFLVENGVGRSVSDVLAAAGHMIERLGEDGAPDQGDAAILRRARENGQIVVTEDKDFGTLVYKDNAPHSGVVLIDCALTRDEKVQQVSILLDHHTEDLAKGHFIRLNGRQIRSNPPESAEKKSKFVKDSNSLPKKLAGRKAGKVKTTDASHKKTKTQGD
jgi:predicted nuclease of predicted toxin-antitoxin system